MPKTILLIATFDTKEEEAKFLKQRIESRGCQVLTLDAGILGANTKINFMYLSHNNFNKNLSLAIQVLFYQIHNYKGVNPVSKKVVIDLFQIMDESNHMQNEFFEGKAILHKLSDDDFKKNLANSDLYFHLLGSK